MSWFHDAVIYELHVRSFQDSDGDGIGDFTGLTSRLDYLADLGVTAIWLLPFYPSPLRDDGYDIADYTGVNPSYGRLADFKRFLKEAHARDLKVITELVMNHTSDQHAWFQKSRRAAPGTKWRDYYVWSDDPSRYAGARIIFQDYEPSNWTWDEEAGAYYWHRFYRHQPDLNFENPEVRQAMFDVIDQWMDMGVDGMRLDAVPYLYEEEGTNCENLPATHQFLKDLRTHLDDRYEDRMLLAEANQWPEDAAAYFGDGDECHMNFHFPVMPRLFMGLKMEDRTPIVDILEQTPEIPDNAQWATFLRNHDELTLEMVTDEERDYMYRSYAQDPQMRVNLGIRRRLAPLLGNDRRTIELLNGLLFSLPGTPVVYYGEELGMGDNVYLGDRDAVRTPMQWSPDRNAGFSRANPHQLFLPPIIEPGYHYETVNVESQSETPNSLLRWMRRIIAQRKRHPVLSTGDIEFLDPDNPHVLAFLRTDPNGEHDPVLVVANLSRNAQHVELDLRDHVGVVPREIFGALPFAPIGELPYYLTLSPYGFFWFTLEGDRDGVGVDDGDERRIPRVDQRWPAARGSTSVPRTLERALSDYLVTRRWFAGKSRERTGIRVTEVVPIPERGRRRPRVHLCLLEVRYQEGAPETYAVPLTVEEGERARQLATYRPDSIVARFGDDDEDGLVVDALAEEASILSIAGLLSRTRPVEAGQATIETDVSTPIRELLPGDQLDVHLLGVEQSNTSANLGDAVMLKLIRRLEAGASPDLEIGRHLQHVGYGHAPEVVGALDWIPRKGNRSTLAVATRYVSNEGDTWSHLLDRVSRYYEDAFGALGPAATPPQPGDETWRDAVAPDLDVTRLLGQRTAELHLALAAPGEPSMAPQPFDKLAQRSLYQSFRNQIRAVVKALRRQRRSLPGDLPDRIGDLRALERHLLERVSGIRDQAIQGQRIRTHGDLHLGQVLWTGKDVVIIDFEGEPARPIGERRIKRSPLADVAGMLRSFHYAAHVGLRQQVERGLLGADQLDDVRGWAEWWRHELASAYVEEYLATIGASETDAHLLPTETSQRDELLDAHLIEKASYEVRYELDNRPSWVDIPLRALLDHAGAP